MARLRPRVGEEDESAIDRSVGEGGDKIARIATAQADVGKALLVDRGEEFGDAVDKGFGADEGRLGMAGSLSGEMLPAAKADLEPDALRRGAEEDSREQLALPGFGDGELRQQVVDQRLLTLRQRLACRAAIEAVLLLGLLLRVAHGALVVTSGRRCNRRWSGPTEQDASPGARRQGKARPRGRRCGRNAGSSPARHRPA